ncbi:MAG: hypothetical protein K6A70_04480 [Erysipelotrichaceae bacterium]|nr:hypothetical protein [Erysipelotrichaceae bacterium]
MAEELLKDEQLNEVAGGAGLRVIGIAKVVTNNLNIRSQASKNSTWVGQTNYPAQYDVYEIEQNEGYIWYRIDYNKWIANDGTWVEFTAK